MRKQDFLSRWSGLLGVWGRSRREKRDRPRTRSLHLEPLEVRQLLTVLTWDPNKDGTFGGTGNWSAENAWLDESTGTRCTWGSSRSGDTAIFKGTAGTVTVDTPSIQAAKLTFSVDSYTIDGANPLTLTGSTSVIANASATINDSLALTSSNQKWVIASGETLSVAQGVTFTNKRLEIQGSGVVTFGGALSGAELRVDTGGTATFAGSSSLTADLVRAGATTSGTINWDSDGTLTVGYCLYVGFNGGTGTFNQTDGRVTTVVHSTFNADVEFYASGTYNLIGGTLETICINGSFGAPAVSAGCSLNITDGTWMALGTFSVGSGLTVTVADGSVAHLNTEGYSVTLAGDVSGGGTLLKEGAGSLTLTGSTTHTGTVRIGAGTLVLGSSLALQSSLLDMNADDEGELSFGTLTAATLGGIQGSRGITIPSGVALTVGGTTSTYAGSITGSGQLIKAGSGTLKLSGDLTAFSGTWSVQQGTLLLGALDSVFADSDELTFSDLLSSALRVADAADSGGEIESWSISPAPTDGTFDISSDGIVSWTPGADCEAAAYAVTVTFAYDGGLQTKVLSFAVDHENTPPTFPCAGVDVGTPTGGWYSHELYYDVQPSGSTDVFNATFTAVDDGGSLTYELIGGPAGCQFNNSTGEVSFALSDDPYTAYEFYVKATDAEGLTDILH
ncbi:MAG: autotransporter-associated beta strand repeat-containing protein, partial [Thermoguttaceae bacterium]